MASLDRKWDPYLADPQFVDISDLERIVVDSVFSVQ